MRIRCEVIEARTKGDKLEVRYQAQLPGQAHWRPTLAGTIELQTGPKTDRAYHVGRVFHMELRPE